METNFYNIKSDKIIKPIRIVMLSDLHNIDYDEIIELVKKQLPDIITVVGDIVDRHKKTYSNSLGFLNELSKIATTYFSYGNHEMKFPVLTEDDIKSTGAILLDNNCKQDGELLICGQTPKADFDWLDEIEKQNQFKLLLCHHPEYYAKHLKHRDIDLIFSGHAHGGQWRFFGHAIYAPNQGIFPKYTSGLYDNKLIVSRGLADTRIVPRIGNPTHILVVDISN